MVYNLTGISTNSTSVVGFASGVSSELMFGWFFTLILIAITIVMFMSFMLRTGDINKSLASTAFVAFAMSILLRAAGLIPNLIMFSFMIAAAAMVAWAARRVE